MSSASIFSVLVQTIHQTYADWPSGILLVGPSDLVLTGEAAYPAVASVGAY